MARGTLLIPVLRQDKIERRDLSPFFVVKGNTAKDYATNIQTEELQKWLETDANLPVGVTFKFFFKFLGQAEENAAAGRFAQGAMLAILFMMSVILLLQFNSFYHVFPLPLCVHDFNPDRRYRSGRNCCE